MASPASPVPQRVPQPVDPDILQGWKEIAAFTGKSVRTVQRWERDFGFPVRRLGSDRESVMAFRSEVSRWMRSHDGRPPGGDDVAPVENGSAGRSSSQAATARTVTDQETAWAAARPRFEDAHWRAARVSRALAWLAPPLALGAAIAAVVWLTGTWPGPSVDRRVPSKWQVAHDTLTVLSQGGRPLWSHRFNEALDAPWYSIRATPEPSRPGLVQFIDLDADGRTETVFVGRHIRDVTLYVFEADGALRFVRAPTSVRFGDESFAAPWSLDDVWSSREPDGTTTLWPVFLHRPWFPSVVEEVAPDGRVRGEYWSNGHVTVVRQSTWQGRPVLLVGAVSNETGGASLAVLDRARVGGAAPALSPEYRCAGCPEGGPGAFLVFPRGCVTGPPGSLPGVRDAWFDDRQQLVVEVLQGDRNRPRGSILYTLSADLSEARAEILPAYLDAHRTLEGEGRLDHAFGPQDVARAMPVQRWEGTTLVPLASGRVTVPH